MSNPKFMYSLRYAIEPGFHEKERLDDLIAFCRDAAIDDVALFINCEELNQGHISKEETVPWMELISRAKEMLTPMGITTSINPWITLLHKDRGRTLDNAPKFTLMVDENNGSATAVVCPLCPEWRMYIKEFYAYYATLEPNILWVEDDFRLHNHTTTGWGGCFCDLHMAEYSKRAGTPLTPVQFLEGVLKTGTPHPYRKIWLDVSSDAMNEAAKIIGKAVYEVSPTTKVGLMSCAPAAHAAEGRDWYGMLRGLSVGTPMVNRTHFPSYTEPSPQKYLWDFSTISRMGQAVLPAATLVYPELENFPHTRFAKSNSFTRFQIETALIIDSQGITFNIFDMMGNGILKNQQYENVLAQIKPFLNQIRGLGLSVGKQKGVKILFDPKSSYTLHTREGRNFTELYPEEAFWAGILSSFGVANTYSSEKEHVRSTVAVSGQYLRNLTECGISALFQENFVLLEAEAAYTLYDMGLGHLAGITKATWHVLHSGIQSYEQVCNGRIYCELADARLSAQYAAGDYLEIEYAHPAEQITFLKNPSGKTIGAGMTVFDDRVFVLPFGRFNGKLQSMLNPIRQEIIQSLLQEKSRGDQVTFVKGVPYVSIYEYDLEDNKAWILLNTSGDHFDEIEIVAQNTNHQGAMEINRDDGRPIEADMAAENGRFVLQNGIRNMELKVLVIAK